MQSINQPVMTPAAFRATRKSLGLTQNELAEALDLSRSLIQQYEKGFRQAGGEIEPVVVPRHVRLALAALVDGHRDFGGIGLVDSEPEPC